MKIISTVAARMGSTRLPAKAMRPILGKPMLQICIERVQRTRAVDEVIVATTTNPRDDVIVAFAEKIGVRCFRGSEEDLVERILGAGRWAQADVIVEITSDCPLIDPAVVDRVVEAYVARRCDYVSNVVRRTYPRGMDTQVFAPALLQRVADVTTDPADREHIGLYVWEHAEQFSIYNVESGLPERDWELRLTVDTVEDFELITAIYEALYPGDPAFSLAHIIALLNRRPELKTLNQAIRQKPLR